MTRSSPPPAIVRLRHAFLALALLGWGVGFLILEYKNRPLSFAATLAFGLAAMAFIWCNGIYWWLEMCFPHVKVGKRMYVSRVEKSSPRAVAASRVFFAGYAVIAVLASIACINVLRHA